MSKMLEKNVRDFIAVGAGISGEYHSEVFSVDCNLNHIYTMKSPIERILYTGLKTITEINNITDFNVLGDVLEGFYIVPQRKIDNYRVDFFIGNYHYNWNARKQLSKELIVECDSQEWHERTEKERRYEKQRDRYITSKGYTMFHFTGKEIIENPFFVASQIISYLTRFKIEDLMNENFIPEKYINYKKEIKNG